MQNKLVHLVFLISITVLLVTMTLNIVILIQQINKLEINMLENKKILTNIDLQLRNWEIIE